MSAELSAARALKMSAELRAAHFFGERNKGLILKENRKKLTNSNQSFSNRVSISFLNLMTRHFRMSPSAFFLHLSPETRLITFHRNESVHF